MSPRKHALDPTRGLYLRGKTWWINLAHQGKPHCLSLGTRDKEEAIRKAATIRDDPKKWIPIEGGWSQQSEMFLDLAAQGEAGRRTHCGKTRQNTRETLNAFFASSELASAAMVRSEHIHAWLDSLPIADVSKVTYHARLSGFFAWFRAMGMAVQTPGTNPLWN